MKTPWMPLLWCAASAFGQSSLGTFAETGAMTTARYWHTATLLNNGQVLIAGGARSVFVPTASAELYDPTRGTFTPTGSMTTARVFHTASLLPDGRVLIAGGTSASDSRGLTSAEIYDPSTGTFKATGGMIQGRECAKAHVLNNGRVLLSGGWDESSSHVADAELYDPTTGSFANAGSYATGPKGGFCAGDSSTLLPNGRVLIVWDFDHRAEIYDPETGLFTQTGKPPRPINLGLATATLLMDGNVLVVGADDNGGDKSTELFNVATGTFSSGTSMSAAHDAGSATRLPSGAVLIAGGFDALGGYGATYGATDVYDPISGIFRAGPELLKGRRLHTATLLNDGRVLFAGGLPDIGASDATPFAELYTPEVVAPAPVLLSILHAGTARLVTASDPAVAGEVLEISCTGLAEGSVIPPQVALGGKLAPVLYLGTAAGVPALNQVNIGVPVGVVPGSAVPVRLTYLGRPSNEVMLGVQ